MTRMHYVFIASILSDLGADLNVADLRTIVFRFANALGSTNPRFDRDRFVRASLPQQ